MIEKIINKFALVGLFLLASAPHAQAEPLFKSQEELQSNGSRILRVLKL